MKTILFLTSLFLISCGDGKNDKRFVDQTSTAKILVDGKQTKILHPICGTPIKNMHRCTVTIEGDVSSSKKRFGIKFKNISPGKTVSNVFQDKDYKICMDNLDITYTESLKSILFKNCHKGGNATLTLEAANSEYLQVSFKAELVELSNIDGEIPKIMKIEGTNIRMNAPKK